jgi:F0F1-type ATP synthase assembly protein I
MSNKPHKESAEPTAWWQPALFMFCRMSGWIIVPVLVALFIGRWLDAKYRTEPWLLLATVGVSFAISMFGIIKDAFREFRKIEDNSKSSKISKSSKNSNRLREVEKG